MMIKTKHILYPALLLFIISFFSRDAFAEEFKVRWNMISLNDDSKVYEEEPLSISLSDIKTEEDKVKKIGSRLIKRELEHDDPEASVTYVPWSIEKRDEVWYLVYNWEYTSAVRSGLCKIARKFKIKIDLNNRIINHERSLDDQYKGSS